MTKLILLFTTLVLLESSLSMARMRVVPEEYESILDAINAAQSDDTVLVRPGIYEESITLPCRDFVIIGQFMLTGDSADINSTVWAAESGMRHLIANPCQLRWRLMISGISFSGGSAPGLEPSGGINVGNREFKLQDSVFDSCFASAGGSIHSDSCETSIERCAFTNSGASFSGRLASFSHCKSVLLDVQVHRSKSNISHTSLISVDGGTLTLHRAQFLNNNLHNEMEFFEVAGTFDSMLIVESTFRENVFNSLFTFNSTQPLEITVSDCVFDSNSVSHEMFSGYTIPNGSRVTVVGTTFLRNWVPQGFRAEAIIELRPGRDFTIKENSFLSNRWTDFVAIAGTQVSTLSAVERNYFVGNASRVVGFVPAVVQICNNPQNSFRYNVFLENFCFGAVSNFADLPRGHAEHNYWGHASGPFNSWSNPSGLGDSVDTLIIYEPWEEDTLFLSVPEESRVPISFALDYPYPNPFNSTVTIKYTLAHEQELKLEIYDLLGRQVETLLSERQGIGVHSVVWNAARLSSGLYFARLTSPETNGAPQAVKLLLMK